MKKNEGMIDRIIRAIIGIVAIYLAYAKFSGWVAIGGYIIGIIAIGTAIAGYCYLYELLGINTKDKK